MMTLTIILLLVGGVLSDYCNVGNCRGRNHIACNNNGRFYSNCRSARLIEFDNSLRSYVLDIHNVLRNKIASGKEPGFPSSSQMATMVWDDELELFAKLNVLQCNSKHDSCRNTYEYPFAGQNLATNSQTSTHYTPKEVIKRGIYGWYNENQITSLNDIRSCCSEKKIGHFTQVVWGKATAIGCAISQYTEGQWKRSLLACNYASGNIKRQAVYKIGKTASECTSRNSKYPGLCAPGDRSIDPAN